MIIRVPRNFLFPLTALAFIALTVEYADIVFTTTTRWIFLGGMTLYLLAKRRFLFGFQSWFGIALLTYCTWCITTSSWSIVPQLSLEKAVAFFLIAASFVSAGQDWIFERSTQKALSYLIPITVIALLAGLSGHTEAAGVAGVEAMVGLTTNPNMAGSLICMALPVLLWNAYKYRELPNARLLWFVLLALASLQLVRTYSRASMLSAAILFIGYSLSIKLPRSSFVLATIAGAVIVVVGASTPLFDTLYHDYVLKGAPEDSGILYTRDAVWTTSYENAKEGGLVGIGYGATVGDTVFRGGLTAFRYGREKGNAQLAVVEETGLVGLGLYCLLLVALFTPLVSAFMREAHKDDKIILGIVTGALAGLTVMSVFEAWWVAPGSPESAYFWSLAGVGMALARKSQYSVKIPVPRPTFRAAAPPNVLPERRMKG